MWLRGTGIPLSGEKRAHRTVRDSVPAILPLADRMRPNTHPSPRHRILPRRTGEQSDRTYPVLYMQDGQNLFTDELALGREWQVDEQMARLSALGLEAIIVGIPNGGEHRIAEYSPFCDAHGNTGRGDQYLQFLFDEVMPVIQREFRVTHTRETTGIMGSSLGAQQSQSAVTSRYQTTMSLTACPLVPEQKPAPHTVSVSPIFGVTRSV